MRIPTYTSEQSVNLPQLNTPQVQGVDLSPIVNLAQANYQNFQREQEEAKKVAIEVERQKTGFEIDKKYMEIQDRIKNGGSYSKAYAEFNDFYTKTVNRSMATFGDDQLTAQKAKLDYEQQAFKYGLNIQSAIKQRAKSDAVAAANSRMAMYEREFFEANTPQEQAAVIQKVNATTSGLEASGIINDGKSRVSKFISNGIRDKATFVAQDNPVAGLAMVEQYKDILDIDTYVSLRGVLKPKAEDYDFANEVEDFIQGNSVTEPDQIAVDGHMNDTGRQMEVEQITPAMYEERIARTISNTGKVPTALKQQVSSLFAMSPDEISKETASQIARSARIVSAATEANPAMVNGRVGGIDQNMRTMADMITEKTRQGVDEFTATRETLRKFNDPVFSEVYKNAKNDVMKLTDNKFANFNETLKNELDIDNTALVLNDAVDIYATAVAGGASAKEATKQAVKQLKGRYAKFNGVDVEMPPHLITSFKDEKAWIDMAQPVLDEQFPELKGQIQPVLMGDSLTRQDIAQGKKSTDIRFRLMYKTEDGFPIPVTDKVNGYPLYIQATPEIKSKKERGVVDLFGGDVPPRLGY